MNNDNPKPRYESNLVIIAGAVVDDDGNPRMDEAGKPLLRCVGCDTLLDTEDLALHFLLKQAVAPNVQLPGVCRDCVCCPRCGSAALKVRGTYNLQRDDRPPFLDGWELACPDCGAHLSGDNPLLIVGWCKALEERLRGASAEGHQDTTAHDNDAQCAGCGACDHDPGDHDQDEGADSEPEPAAGPAGRIWN